MKKVVLIAAMATAVFGCNSNNNANDNEGKEGVDAESSNVTPGILNANGNIPDTSNAMDLSSNDSTAFHARDSLANIGGDTTKRNTQRK